MILDVDQRRLEDMSPAEQRRFLEAMILDNDPFWASGEAPIEYEELLSRFFSHWPPSNLTGKRRPKNGAYLTCAELAQKTGYHEDTIRKRALKEKSGIDKRTFAGRNRKAYTVLRISRVTARRMFPEAEI